MQKIYNEYFPFYCTMPPFPLIEKHCWQHSLLVVARVFLLNVWVLTVDNWYVKGYTHTDEHHY